MAEMKNRQELVEAFTNAMAHGVLALNELLKSLVAEDETSTATEEAKEETERAVNKAPADPSIPIESVRKVLAEKSRAGFQPQVKALIRSYGVDRLTDVPAEQYADLLQRAEGLE